MHYIPTQPASDGPPVLVQDWRGAASVLYSPHAITGLRGIVQRSGRGSPDTCVCTWHKGVINELITRTHVEWLCSHRNATNLARKCPQRSHKINAVNIYRVLPWTYLEMRAESCGCIPTSKRRTVHPPLPQRRSRKEEPIYLYRQPRMNFKEADRGSRRMDFISPERQGR